jgi:phosphoglycerate kinase
VELEVKALSKVADGVERPYVVLASGAKLEDKIGMLRALAEKADVVCIGGKIANAFLAAAGKLDATQFRADDVAAAQALLSHTKKKLRLPLDIVTGSEDGKHYVRAVPVENIEAASPAWDIGPETVKEFAKACQTSKTIVWNGPMGRVEVEAYMQGTAQLAQALSSLPAYRVVGGGDTVTALHKVGLAASFDHMSVGGGAMIAFLEGKRMPALEPLFE